ncbi:hypothetical protein FRC03_004798 [Tulasnella sp. 419]|nr:hypothetical protein FRC03_004798 [Tulasnella sp. 419]
MLFVDFNLFLQTFIQLQTGVQLPAPLQLPFTHVTNEEERADKRDSFVIAVDDILVIGFWLFFAGIMYQTAGGVALERATSLSTHLQAMGCLRPARYISWHLSVSLVYLPAWVIAAGVWKHMVFVRTSAALLVGINLVTGFSLTSWALLVATPFAKSPQLAAIVTTALSLVLAILGMAYVKSQGFALLFTILFPPSFFIFAIRSVCGWERVFESPIPRLEDPKRHYVISSLIVAAVFTIFIHPLLAMWLERMLFDTKSRRPGLFSRTFGRHTSEDSHNHGQVNAIEVRNLRKEFKSRTGRKVVTAIADLSLSIPRNGIFVVLGSNGSGKSTLHGIISNIISPTSGSVTFAGGAAYPDRGDIGVVPQKNVLFPELTCRQTVRLWSDIKRPVGAELDDIDQLLLDCDLSSKVHAKSGSLSGGQKRKLQLAIGLVGGSSILLVDEATSGVDPLSRRSIWRTLSAVRTTRTVIFTTHFLDEADLLGDDICILAAPGKLLAHGPPVSLKARLGSGYSVNVFLHEGMPEKDGEHALRHIHDRIKSFSRDTKLHTVSSTHGIFSLLMSDTTLVSSILRMLEQEKSNGSSGIKGYDIHGATLEDAFLGLMKTELDEGAESDFEKESLGGLGHRVSSDEVGLLGQPLDLADAKRVSPLTQAVVIFRKRLLILKRSWLAPLIAVAIACCGACIPLTFMKNRDERCQLNEEQMGTYIASYPLAVGFLGMFEPDQATVPIIDPPSLLDLVNASSIPFNIVPSGSSFEQEVAKNYRQLEYGGLSVNFATRESQLAYYAEIGYMTGPVFVNLASNVLLNSIQGTTGARIIPEIGSFPSSFPVNTGRALKWIGFFVAALVSQASI